MKRKSILLTAVILGICFIACKPKQGNNNAAPGEKDAAANDTKPGPDSLRKYHLRAVSTGGDYSEEDALSISEWKTDKATDYTGQYHFGFSETEWTMVVTQAGGTYTFQKMGAVYDEKENRWGGQYQTFNNVRIEGNNVLSDSLKGFFALYKDREGKLEEGLVLFSPFHTITDSGEYGSLQEYYYEYNGDYPEISESVLPDEYFNGKTKMQLKIMRSEVLARYGYGFKKEKDMYNYFIKQDWYKGNTSTTGKTNVDDCLTTVEKLNIANIQRFENK